MIRQLMWLLALVLIVAPCRGDSEPKDYLGDGKLKEPLEIRDVQGGFAGFTGKMWRIEPDGKWTMGSVFQQKVKEEAKGQLSAKQLEALAKDLARFDLSGLKDQGKAKVNPHVVTIKWGKREATLTVGAGEKLPAADAKTIEGRFSGIVDSVQQSAKMVKEKGA